MKKKTRVGGPFKKNYEKLLGYKDDLEDIRALVPARPQFPIWYNKIINAEIIELVPARPQFPIWYNGLCVLW